jgi:ribonucleoside-diphosphate reductase alpha chain
MIKTVVKRDGTKEAFSPEKINKWGEWGAKSLGKMVDWSSVVLHSVSLLPEECPSTLLQERLIKTCLEFDTWSYNRMAGRLYAALINKNMFNDGKKPSIKELHNKLQELGLMVKLNYTDEQYVLCENMIDHKKDFSASYYELHQVYTKYAIKNRVKGVTYETPQFTVMRMAMALAESRPESTKMIDVENFYHLFSDKILNAPTPNWVNLGTSLNGYASCAVYTVNDNAKSLAIGDHIAYTMTCMSAGIGSHLNVRSLNDPVRGGAISHMGKLPYYRSMVAAAKANQQAGRGGAVTTHFTCYDPEVQSIIKLKNPMSTDEKKIRGMDYSFGSNKFFARKVAKDEQVFLFNNYTAPDLQEALYSGDSERFEELYNEYEQDDSFSKQYVSARELLIQQMNEAYETGRAYLHWTDEMNKHTPFKDVIYSSNLCVAPETKILTQEGYKPIAELEGENVEVWNGHEWSEVTVRKTGENQKLVKVTTDSGYELECTPNHKFYIFTGYKKPYKEVRAYELKEGDKLAKFDLPVIDSGVPLERAYENGFYSGDGCYYKGTQIIYLYHDKMLLKDNFTNTSWNYQENQKRMVGITKGLRNKFFVPSEEYDISSRLEWLAGYLDADGCIYNHGTNQQLTACSVEYEFLREVQLMLQTLGVSCKITPMMEEGFKAMPANDGTGELKDFYCRESWRLLITSNDAYKLKVMGLDLKRLKLNERLPQRDAKRFVRVVDVIDEGRYDDTYCFNEPKRHTAMFNGILTGQCKEIHLPTKGYNDMRDLYSEEEHHRGEIALCSLAAVNIANVKSDEEYAKAAYYALLMIDICIHKSEWPFPHLKYTAQSRMNAGVGVIGLAHHMAKNKKRYSSQEGKDFIHEVAETHMWHLINASLRLGKELGNAEWIDKTKWPDGWLPIDSYNKNVDNATSAGYKRDWESLRKAVVDNGGIRNSVVGAIMPSEASSVACGTTNAIYPIRELTLIKTDNNRATYWAAPEGDRIGHWYEMAWDIPAKDMIEVYAIFQKFIDQGISADMWRRIGKGEYVDSKEMISDYLYMTKMGLKTRYYQNSKTSEGVDINSSEGATGCAGGACTL